MISDRTLREVVRTVSVSYAVPFVSSLLIVAGLICLGLALVAPVPLNWIITAVGAISFASAISAFFYAAIFRPELLRSERHITEQRLLDIISDANQDADARAIAGDVLAVRRPETEVPKVKDDQLGAALVTKEVEGDG